jgi:hypothetical protein
VSDIFGVQTNATAEELPASLNDQKIIRRLT